MNQPLVTFELRKHYLLVTGHGKRSSLTEMVSSATTIFQKIVETNSHKIIIDYRQLDILQLNLSEAYNIVKTYETKMPDLRSVTIAGVFEAHHRPFALYWQEVSTKRGFTVKNFFGDFDAAEQWLLAQP